MLKNLLLEVKFDPAPHAKQRDAGHHPPHPHNAGEHEHNHDIVQNLVHTERDLQVVNAVANHQGQVYPQSIDDQQRPNAERGLSPVRAQIGTELLKLCASHVPVLPTF